MLRYFACHHELRRIIQVFLLEQVFMLEKHEYSPPTYSYKIFKSVIKYFLLRNELK